MKLGLFIPTRQRNYNNISASLWIRCLQMVPYYKAIGIDVHINNPFRKYDISIFFRGVNDLDYNFIRFLKKISYKVLWDTVVDYYVEHDACNSKQRINAERISSLVDGIIVSSRQLSINAMNFNENVFYMPDPVDIKFFCLYKKYVNYDFPIFGWSGVSSKISDLKKYSEILSGRTIIISDNYKDVGFKHDFHKWNYNSFPRLISHCDIGFFPRKVDGPYNLSHSSFKILVFAIQGLPIIANKIPSYVELSDYYPSICFLEDVEDIVEAINFLKNKSRSVETLMEHYSCDIWSQKTHEFLCKLI